MLNFSLFSHKAYCSCRINYKLPLPPQNTQCYCQKRNNQIVLTKLESKKLSGKPTQQLKTSLGALKKKEVNNSVSQHDLGGLNSSKSQKVCLIAIAELKKKC